jgi:hypothetical protein
MDHQPTGSVVRRLNVPSVLTFLNIVLLFWSPVIFLYKYIVGGNKEDGADCREYENGFHFGACNGAN